MAVDGMVPEASRGDANRPLAAGDALLKVADGEPCPEPSAPSAAKVQAFEVEEAAARVLHPRTPVARQVLEVLKSPRILIWTALYIVILILCIHYEAGFKTQVKRKEASVEACRWRCEQHELYKGLKASKADLTPWCVGGEDFTFKAAKPPATGGDCSFYLPQPRWLPLVVIGITGVAVALIVDGIPTEVVLLLACAILCVIGIPYETAFAGLGEKSVAVLAMLFPIAYAIDETGALEFILSNVLGTPSNLATALFRLMAVTTAISAVLANTAVVAAMIPAIVSWARRINISPSYMLMPLSFAAQLGGSCTLVGSSVCLVCQGATRYVWGTGEKDEMGMFSNTPIGVLLAVVVTGASVLFAGLLPSRSVTEAGGADEEVPGTRFVVCVTVQPKGVLTGKTVQETGIKRLPGIFAVDKQSCQEPVLVPSEEVQVSCSADGLVHLRQVRGFDLINAQELMTLGTHRRRRRLFEATVRAGAPILAKDLTTDEMRRTYGACVVSARRPGQASPIIWRRFGLEPLEGGDIVLLEADQEYCGSAAWSKSFSLVRELQGSAPPRMGTPADGVRSVAVCIGMGLLLVGVGLNDLKYDWNFACKQCPILYAAGVFLCLLLATRTVTPDTLYSTIRIDVLLTIAGAFGLGNALQVTGVADLIAVNISSMVRPMGRIGVYAALYVLAAGLSAIINNQAVVIMVAPMLDKLRFLEDGTSIPGEFLALTLLYGAGTCLTTPIGYQTNMMVVKDGGYTFADFIKYGGPIQLVHAVTCVLSCFLYEKWMS